jgi:FlaA1/EpsC-like NDP-sugar epimerase
MAFKNLATSVLGIPRFSKRVIVLTTDVGLCLLSVWLAFYLRLGEWVPFSGDDFWRMELAFLVSTILAIPIFITQGFYRAIFRYSGVSAFITIARAMLVYSLFYAAFISIISFPGIPRTVGLIQPMILLLLVGASRAVARFWLGGLYQSKLKQASLPKALIYGAGTSGRQLAAAMESSHEMRVVGFIDDDDRLHGHVLNGLTIYSPEDLSGLCETLNVSDVLLAIPSVDRHRRNEILNSIQQTTVAVRTLPSVTELAQGRVTISDLRELDIDDLLGREPVPPNHILMSRDATGKVVLVTGAGGSIGSELCRQIINLDPRTLILLEFSEYALYTIHAELSRKIQTADLAVQVIPLLASVWDEDRVSEILDTWRPDTVYHTAAYKHVPLVEHNPVEGIRNNVFGTLVVAQAAVQHGVASFVLISTDKAVRPTSIMGASKRLAEMVLQALNHKHEGSARTKFSMVRFGNVLDSSGSVVPRFRQQIKEGGPVTVTHPEVNRFFMTIPEASQLVIQAGAMASGGDVFVLDMGEPIKIMDLAKNMIQLSGVTVRSEQNPDGDIEIVVTGLRPAEKLYEELLIGENPQSTRHPRILRAHDDFLTWENLEPELDTLLMAINLNDIGVVRKILEKVVNGYQPNEEVVDWIFLEQSNSSE